MIKSFSLAVLLLFSTGLYAQKLDTIKKERILKQWNLSSDFSQEVDIPIDTVFSLFNRFKIADKYSPVNASLGNYGLPFYQISFFDRITDPDKFLYSALYPFMFTPERDIFMNTQVPFTELVYTSGGPRETAEQTFRVRHSQNVNRFLNFGLIYDVIYDLGQYNYQRASDKNFTLSSSYTGPKYKFYIAGNINNMTSYENGGIPDSSDLNIPNARDIPVNLGGLNNAKSVLKNRSLLLVQRYTFGSNSKSKTDTIPKQRSGLAGLSGTFSHIFILESNRRSYSDSYPKSGFYDTTYISPNVTFDTLYSRSIKNTIRFDFETDETRKFRLGGGVGIRNEIIQYYQGVLTHDTLYPDTTSKWRKSNNILVGRLYNNIGDKFRWTANGELYITGYRAGDFKLNGEMSKSFDLKKGRASLLFTGGITNSQPSFWYDQWGGNNFEWQNNMAKEFRIDLGSSILYPARKTEIRFNYAIITNFVDFDTNALPSQHTGALSIAALAIRKEFRVWKFHLTTDAIIQKSTNKNVLDLPLAAIRSAGYIEHLFRFAKTGGKLNTQFGADVTYNTIYYPYSYMPATGRFYRQDQTTTGNYPFINIFVNLKVKRTRAFIMFDHFNSGRMGYNYYMIPHYPMNIRMFRYGIAWTFYN